MGGDEEEGRGAWKYMAYLVSGRENPSQDAYTL